MGLIYSVAYIRGAYIWGAYTAANIGGTYIWEIISGGLISGGLYPRSNIRGLLYPGGLYLGLIYLSIGSLRQSLTKSLEKDCMFPS